MSDGTTVSDHTAVTFYWRPGCPYCAMLRSGLRRAGVEFREVNIWDDPSAAAFVRSVARGNETVPTVTVGAAAMVNPSAGKVVELLRRLSPEQAPLPAATTGPRRPFWRKHVAGN
jgi:mycoredoxin